jgi:hypothetical protein
MSPRASLEYKVISSAFKLRDEGREITISNIAKDLGIMPETVGRWLGKNQELFKIDHWDSSGQKIFQVREGF